MYKIKNKSSTNSAPVRRGKSPLIYRLTGRDGPPGFEMISGVLAWLARRTPAQYRNFGMHHCANEGKVRGPDTSGMPGMTAHAESARMNHSGLPDWLYHSGVPYNDKKGDNDELNTDK